MIVKENTNIVQANFLIENRPKFTKDETRLYLTIIGAVNKDDTDFKPLEIPVSEFADLWGMDSSAAYRKIKTALRGLVQKEFFIEGINQNTGKKRFLSAAYLSMAAYEEGQGYATVEISQSFKPYLIALKEKYTQYVLENIMNLTTVNAIRNYELLKQYESLGVRIFTVEEYKKALKIENKYSLNADLRRYVLNPAVEEINQNTDISVEYEIAGRGKKSKIKFTIELKNQTQKTVLAAANEDSEEDDNQLTFDDILDRDVPSHLEILIDQLPEFSNEQLDLLFVLAQPHVPLDVKTASPYDVRVSRYIIQKVKLMDSQKKPVASAARFKWLRGAVSENWQ